MGKSRLETFEKTMEVNELKWYLYDIINEVMGKDSREEYSLNKEKKNKVCLLRKESSWHVIGKTGNDVKQYDNFYYAVSDFFNRVYDEEKSERALSLFLTRTLDLPVMMKKNSSSLLKSQISDCQKEVSLLEEKVKKRPGKKEEMKLTLNRIYLRGLKEKLEKVLETDE